MLNTDGSAINSHNIKIIPNHHLTYELHKPVFRKAESCEVYSSFRDNIWSCRYAIKKKIHKGIQLLLLLIFL